MDFRTTSLTDLADSVRARTDERTRTHDDGSRSHRRPESRATTLSSPSIRNEPWRTLPHWTRSSPRAAILDRLPGSRWRSRTTTTLWASARRTARPVLADAPAATADSPFVARLRAAGCVVVGKTNMPEFAWSSNTTNAVFGPTANPFNTVHGPGGSSGRVGGGARRWHGAPGHRFGRRRLDTAPVGLLRALGDEAVARPGPRRRPHPAELDRPLDERAHGTPHRWTSSRRSRWRSARTRRTSARCPAPKRRGWPRWRTPTSLSAWRGPRHSATERSTRRFSPSASTPSTVLESLGADVSTRRDGLRP